MLEQPDKALHYQYKNLLLTSEEIKTKKDEVRHMVSTYNLGSSLYNMEAYRLSLHYLNIVLKKWKKHGFANRTIAAVYTDLGMFKQALIHAETAFPKEDTINAHSYKNQQKISGQ
ncbi:hypothetical protein KFZ70_16945 [Tamlana fucoidanivorans]|uniref:Tetratricopeptide repeat protein n=1 Tax=Allotamlana fucoidanivorans TaxID=2583814 RepID=A0A5C4SIC4_9FLAO|nr:hypothetical protein [Tamlana fucoidanivorans]TNJ43484.1 hypothetical protein FGF67_11235 [Tamlana fucoidanivorans]